MQSPCFPFKPDVCPFNGMLTTTQASFVWSRECGSQLALPPLTALWVRAESHSFRALCPSQGRAAQGTPSEHP